MDRTRGKHPVEPLPTQFDSDPAGSPEENENRSRPTDPLYSPVGA